MGCQRLTYRSETEIPTLREELKPVYCTREGEATREAGWSRQNLKKGVETGNYYYGARYYDPKVSVWLSVDPKASSFPDVSPYVFNMNNPIMFIDPGGDSTFFFDFKGNYMGMTTDELDNAVVIVDEDGIEGVNGILNDMEAGKYDDRYDEMAQNARDHGQAYDYQGMIDFGENNTTFNNDGSANEVGSYLYKGSDGIIRVNDNQVIEGGRHTIDWGENPPDKPGASGNFHTHPSLYTNAPSGLDYYSHFTSTPERDVIYSGSHLIFYNSSNTPYDTYVPVKLLK